MDASALMMTSAIGQLKNDKPQRRNAFTLIELILVMAILTIAIAIAAPSMGSFFRGRTQDSEARRLLTLIRYGQSRAVSEGIPALLWVDVRSGTYGLELQSGYTSDDSKAVELTIDKDLTLEIGQNTGTVVRGRELPSIRFSTDGQFEASSLTKTPPSGLSNPAMG